MSIPIVQLDGKHLYVVEIADHPWFLLSDISSKIIKRSTAAILQVLNRHEDGKSIKSCFCSVSKSPMRALLVSKCIIHPKDHSAKLVPMHILRDLLCLFDKKDGQGTFERIAVSVEATEVNATLRSILDTQDMLSAAEAPAFDSVQLRSAGHSRAGGWSLDRRRLLRSRQVDAELVPTLHIARTTHSNTTMRLDVTSIARTVLVSTMLGSRRLPNFTGLTESSCVTASLKGCENVDIIC